MTTQETGYNGWRNYETWLVALWIDNDEGTQDAAREIAQETALRSPERECPLLDNSYWAVPENRNRWYDRKAGDAIRDFLEDPENGALPDTGASLAADLIGSALESVDWEAIGRHYQPEEAPTVEDEA